MCTNHSLLYRGSLSRVVSVWGVSVQGVSVQIVSVHGGLCPEESLSGGSLFGGLCQVDPCGQTDTCENITLPETSFAGDKNTNERNVNVLIVDRERNADDDTELCFFYFCLSQTSFDEHGLSKVCITVGSY